MDVLIIGPVPPPVDGRALATSWLVDALRCDGQIVTTINTQTGRSAKLRNCLRAALNLLFRQHRPDRVVVVASGGAGLLMEMIPLLAARIGGVATTLTHHSSRYVRSPSWTLRMAIALGGRRLHHAVLDDAMGAELASRYRIPNDCIVVVDNAGLMPLPPRPPDAPRHGVVHLSNLSADKGLAAVLEVADRTGIPVRLVGPPSKDAAIILQDAARRGLAFIAVGPRHGMEKTLELTAARCMLFPSSYQHEAQPLVLYEAAAAGCVPVVWRNGWIGEQLGRLGLDEYVFPVGDVDGIATAVRQIEDMDDRAFAELSERVRSALEVHNARSREQFRALVE